MPEEPENPTKAKRSQVARELIRILKPYSPEDRKRLLDTAGFMMGGE